MAAPNTEPEADVRAIATAELEAGVRVLEQREVGRHEPKPGVVESVHVAIVQGRAGLRSARVLVVHDSPKRRAVFTIRAANLPALLSNLTAALDAIEADRRAHARNAPSNRTAWRALRLPRELLELVDATGESLEAIVRRAAVALLERERGER